MACAATLNVTVFGVVGATSAVAAPRDLSENFGSATSSPPPQLVATFSPARFFTINAVLAKHDSEQRAKKGIRADNIQLASMPNPQTTTDNHDGSARVTQANNGPEPFGLYSFTAPEGALWHKWRGVEADIAREKTVLDRCEREPANCPPHAAQFLRLIKAAKSRSGREQLDEVNRAVNIAIRYVSDMVQHGEADRWSAPLATFAAARGDCEDFVIAKYVVLREAGVSADDLRVTLVRDRAVREDHAILAVRHEGRWLIMDNRYSSLMDDREAMSFSPLFAINHRGVHLFATSYAGGLLANPEDSATPAAASNNDAGQNPDHLPRDSGADLGAVPLLI